MSPPTTKRLQVTFRDWLPMGTSATFKHDGQLWIAYPSTKNTRILAGVDRMIGIYGRVTADMVRWINDWPDDAIRVTAILESIGRGQTLARELIIEKTEARTM